MKEIKKGIRAMRLQPLEHKLSIVYIDTLNDIYEAINARCFTTAYRQVGNNPDRKYIIYCDDMGLYKKDNYLSAYGDKNCFLVGDILIAKHNDHGDMIDMENVDIDYIGKQIWRTIDKLNREIDILFPISYPQFNH